MDDEQLKTAVEQAKARWPESDVEAIEVDVGKETLAFVMRSPNRDEWKKYRGEMAKARGDEDAIEGAVERCALAMITHPARDQVAKIFARKPGVILTLGPVIARMAGVEAEAREKKL